MMFKKAARAKPQRADAVQERRRNGASITSVGPDLTVRGTIEGNGEIEILGAVDGQIKGRTVTVAEGGRVEGTIVAEYVRVRGTIEGSIRATTVEIARTARVIGDITHLNLSVEEGAYLEGRRPWRPRPLGREQEQFTFSETD